MAPMAMPRRHSRSIYDLLLVEDRPYDVEIIRAVLKDRNHRVRFNSVPAFEALDFVYRRGKYTDAPLADLVLIDGGPHGEALDILKRIREHCFWAIIPVIVLSDEQHIDEWYNIRANACIEKPSSLEELAAIVARALVQSRRVLDNRGDGIRAKSRGSVQGSAVR
jgi:DNA-binding response OmpR family regulator